MKAVVAAFNQEKALVGAFSVITNLRMELFVALVLVYLLPQCLRVENDVDEDTIEEDNEHRQYVDKGVSPVPVAELLGGGVMRSEQDCLTYVSPRARQGTEGFRPGTHFPCLL